ncbi:DUF2334 domain-containing protein [Priestia taiwanensis]|uniref:DUF2334 domain-containing protein n=1 Tax=Priestia taiwanensis TaxID=1347902 RepID=A0A917AWE3_9BACI|nr:DUF2334 domain-containing protein [Priestia taiwanensis]MBM7364688.1 uncharacterized protein YdaL [Priestia taiwanensis]GGE78893.1 hypothetical protein GCM10007140_30530 [Priestia taiwanensis]
MRKGLISFIICLLCIPSVASTHAQEAPRKVLLIYSNETNEIDAQVRILDMLVGHFTTNVTIKGDIEVTEEVMKEQYTHVIYFGEKQKQVASVARDFIDTFSGPVLWIGHNVEQVTHSFPFVQIEGEGVVNTLSMSEAGVYEVEGDGMLILDAKPSQETKTLINGKGKQEEYPLLIQQENRMYAATPSLFDPVGKLLGEAMFSFFGQEPLKEKTKMYLRLEDIHPASDPELLKEIAVFLKEHNIPYMVVVIPVYTNPETQKTLHFSDAKEVRDVLQYMQKNGGSIVLHGYNHQYRQQETGEGFEFWDVDNDSPIYQDKDDVHRKRDDFATEEEYKAYLVEAKKFEEKYTKEKVVNGVTELVSHDLYPLAFEAPHYTMSQAGYEIVSRYFSTYVGQLQMSDKTWGTMYKTAYKTSPTFLHGMKFIPETVGFVEGGNVEDIDKMYEQAKVVTKLSNGMIGGFYHPYLGVDTLQKLVEKLETIPNTEWFDLRTVENSVEVPNIHISTDGKTSDIHVDEKATTIRRWVYLHRMYFPFVLVGGVAIGFGMTYYRNRTKKDNR